MAKPTIKTFNLQEHTGQYVTVPRRLGGRRKSIIQSAGTRSPITGFVDGRIVTVPTYDPNAMAWASLIQAVTHPDAAWNLRGDDGKILSRNEETINESTEYEEDFLVLASEIFAFVFLGRDESAEGNVDESAETPDVESSSKPSSAHKPRK